MYYGKKVSIVFPCYNEDGNIRNAINEFLQNPAVDELIVVDNNSKDGSAKEIQKTSAKYILETTQGYGAALRRGMKEATGDLIVTVEPDGTFKADDLERLLVYSKEYEVVLGARTSRNPVWSGGDVGANMDFALRVGNWGVAKFLEYLFNGPSFTDVGCTYKLIHRHAYEKIKGTFTVDGSWFSPEFMIRVLQHKLRVVEIPVRYGARIGISKITGERSKAILLGFTMIRFIIAERLGRSYRPLVGLLVATLLLTTIPALEMAGIFGSGWHGILPGFTDELNYARVEAVVHGHPTLGNAYFLEHADGPSLVIFGGAWINALPQLLGIPLLPALYLNFIVWSLLFVLFAYWFLRELRLRPWISTAGTLLLYIQSFEHVWRPVNLQPVYPFYFLLYIAILRFIRSQSRANSLLLIISIGLSFYLLAYLWQITAITIGLLLAWALWKKDRAFFKRLFTTSFFGFLLGLPVLVYMASLAYSSPYFWESMGRLGLVHTHIPMAEVLYSGGWIGASLLFSVMLFYKKGTPLTAERRSLWTFIIVSGLGLWIMQGSNLITGKLLETGEHIRLLLAPWLFCITLVLALELYEHYKSLSLFRKYTATFLFTTLLLANVYYTYRYIKPFIPNASTRALWRNQQAYSGPFDWLNKNDPNSVVVWSDPHDPLGANLPIYTKDFTLYAYWGMLELVPEGEIRERYLITQYFSNPSSADLRDDREVSLYLGRHDYPHQAKTIERKIKICRILFLWDHTKECGEIPTPQDLLGDTFFNDLENKFTNDIRPNIRTYLKKYHVSYILKDKLLNPEYNPSVLDAMLVYRDERYELYHFQ